MIVKCKDKSSNCWLAAQNTSVIGSRPSEVHKDGEVAKKLKLGVLVECDKAELDRYNKKVKEKAVNAKNDNSKKIKENIDFFEKAITDHDPKVAKNKLNYLKKLGFPVADASKMDSRIGVLKQQIADEEDDDIQHKEYVSNLVQNAIEKELITPNEAGVLTLGDNEVGSDADQVIEWVLSDEKNELLLDEALKNAN